VKFVLPGWPPSINDSHFSKGRRLKPETRTWIMNAGLIMRGQAHGQRKIRPSSRLSLHVRLYGKWTTKAGTMRRVDLSNRIKILEDTVAKVCSFDDSQVCFITASKVTAGSERTEVEVLEL